MVPGASFRGLHDSLVNYGGNRKPQIVVCNHEMISVALARGYTRVTGRPMAAALHNLVGLANAGASIYDCWTDRIPVLLLGGNGPMDATRRRPWIDWIHTANAQGALFRDFLKWDDQPASIEAIPQAVLRAYQIAMTEPTGPTYVSFDSTHQEQRVVNGFELPDVSRFKPPAAAAPDHGAIAEAARMLTDAALPMAWAGTAGRDREAVASLVELAELLAMPVIDGAVLWQSFPTTHDLDFYGLEAELSAESDVLLVLGAEDLGGLRARGSQGRRIVSISLELLSARGFSGDVLSLSPIDVPVLASPRTGLPALLEECRRVLGGAGRSRIERRRRALALRKAALTQAQGAAFAKAIAGREISAARLVHETWLAVRDHPFAFTSGNPRQLAPGAIGLSGPEENLNGAGAGVVGNHTGVALGAALGLRGSGRLPVALVGDGDLLMAPQALWTAVHHGIPGVWIVVNNRAYGNDEGHQESVATERGRPVENSWVGVRLDAPAVDFAKLAVSMGAIGIGPVREPAELRSALNRAVEEARAGAVVLVDVWT